MVYEYDDSFVVDSLAPGELDKYEAEAIVGVGKLGVSDDHYIKRLVIARTYMLACRAQYEADGMEDKYKVYEKEYDRAIKEATLAAKTEAGIKSDQPVWTVKVGRS